MVKLADSGTIPERLDRESERITAGIYKLDPHFQNRLLRLLRDSSREITRLGLELEAVADRQLQPGRVRVTGRIR